MNLDKAIEILTDQATNPALSKLPDLKDSLLLSIEALKRHKALSKLYPDFNEPPLPGETPFIDTNRSGHTIKKILESPIGREPKD